jgi:vacuolar protein sorting-associated protein 13D
MIFLLECFKFKEIYAIFFQFIVSYDVGEVELENLPLKKDALSHFGVPIKAYSGSIGKIKLQIPVRQFRTAPWCINIEKVYIVCGPVNLEEVTYLIN